MALSAFKKALVSLLVVPFDLEVTISNWDRNLVTIQFILLSATYCLHVMAGPAFRMGFKIISTMKGQDGVYVLFGVRLEVFFDETTLFQVAVRSRGVVRIGPEASSEVFLSVALSLLHGRAP